MERPRRVLKYYTNSEVEGLGNTHTKEGSPGFDRRILGIVLLPRRESRERLELSSIRPRTI
jgi:hypothetical protein